MSEGTRPATIQWKNDQPFSTEFDDVYFSRENGLAETDYVFLQHNQLQQRWQQPLTRHIFTIGETGFGTGLNFLMAWQLWQKSAPRDSHGRPARLHFLSVEKYPLSFDDLHQALALWPQLKALAGQLLDQYPVQPAEGVHRLLFDNSQVALTLCFDDASRSFQQCLPASSSGTPAAYGGKACQFGEHPVTVDAWFLDGFAPAKNPDMWQPELFTALAALSSDQATFATFTAAGLVKRGLATAGFECTKVAGFGQKREMLCGRIGTSAPALTTPDSSTALPRSAPASLYWHLLAANEAEECRQAVVIGGGLAGCHAANALARRGVAVTLLEQHPHLGAEASGNLQGALYTRLSPHDNPLNRFNLLAQQFAERFYQREQLDQSEQGQQREQTPAGGSTLFELCGQRTGVLHLAIDDKSAAHYQALAQRYSGDPRFCSWVTPEQASELAGVTLRHPAIWLPNAGWLSPPALCKALCQHPNITVRTSSPVASVSRDGRDWQLLANNGERLASASVVVIANAQAACLLSPTAQLPLKRIRGQVSHLEEASTTAALGGSLRTVVCGEGYITPPRNRRYCLGATFTLGNQSPEATLEDHQINLDGLASFTQARLTVDQCANLEARVGFRTTTPDYFPLVGPVPDVERMHRDFAALRHRANSPIEAAGSNHPGLYTLVGLGSRGLAYAPLCADLLGSLICGEPLPLTQFLYSHLHPARFLIRDLIRNKASTL